MKQFKLILLLALGAFTSDSIAIDAHKQKTVPLSAKSEANIPNMTLQQRLTQQPWVAGDKHMLYIDERYFTYDDKGKLFDHGVIEYIDDNRLFLRSGDGWGTISVQQADNDNLTMSGTLYTIMGGTKLVFNIQPSIEELTIPATEHLVDAALYGDNKTIEKMLDDGGDINQLDGYGHTALMAASSAWHASTVELLLTRGANIQLKNKQGKNALHMAIEVDHVTAIQLLLKQGLKPDNSPGELNALILAGNNNASLETYRLLLDNGASLTIAPGETLLHAMVDTSRGAFSPRANLKVIEFLLERGIDTNILYAKPHSYYDDGLTPVMMAASYGFSDMLSLLIEHGADVTQANLVEDNALDFICRDHNKNDEKIKATIEQQLRAAGLTETKSDRAHRIAKEIETLALAGEGEQALERLASAGKLLRKEGYRSDTFKELAYRRMNNASVDQLEEALYIQKDLYSAGALTREAFTHQVLEVYDRLVPQLKPGEKTDNLRKRAMSVIKEDLEDEDIDETRLQTYLAHSLKYSDGEKLNGRNASYTNNLAIKLSGQIYQQLVAIDSKRYLPKQIDFFIDTQPPNEPAFGALFSLWQQYPKSAATVEGRLQDAYERLDEPRLPRQAFEDLSALHQAAGRESETDWYYRRMTQQSPTNEDYWTDWVEALTQRDDKVRLLEVCDEALTKIDTPKIIATKIAIHKQRGDLDEAYREVINRLNASEHMRNAVVPFLEAGADPKMLMRNGNSILSPFVRAGHLDAVRQITERFAIEIDTEMAGSGGMTLFSMLAAGLHYYPTHTDYMDLLLSAGANPNWQDSIGQTALFRLVELNDARNIEILITRYGFDPDITDHYGQMAADVAMILEYDDVVKVLTSTK